MLSAPLAGPTTDMPLPASVFIAFPAVTQLLTGSPALNASSSTTACGPPPINATGMSRPTAADGTIRYSTPAALAPPGDAPPGRPPSVPASGVRNPTPPAVFAPPPAEP